MVYLSLLVDQLADAERFSALFALPHAAALGVHVLADALPLFLRDAVVRHEVTVDAVYLPQHVTVTAVNLLDIHTMEHRRGILTKWAMKIR